jgi:hypothetical protein
VADVEHLTGVGSRGHQGMLAEHLGVAIGGTVFLFPVHLADGRVDVDGHRGLSRSGTESPSSREQLLAQSVELADVPVTPMSV